MKRLRVAYLMAVLTPGVLIPACTQAADVYTPSATYTPGISLTVTPTRQPETVSPTATPTPTPTLTITPSPVPPNLLGPLPEGRIVFSSLFHNLFVVNANGATVRLTSDEAQEDREAEWSPDGQWIAFLSYSYWSPEDPEIRIINPDQPGITPLQVRARGEMPTWSPDGQQIIFLNSDGLMRMNLDGTNQTLLLDSETLYKVKLNDDVATNPAWSPVGRWLSLDLHNGGCGAGLVLLDLQDYTVRYLLDYAKNLDWSSDGRKVAFAKCSEDYSNFDIYTMNLDGTGLTRLTDDPANDFQPTWSPSGRFIAFVSWRDGQREIYVMNADGTNQVRLTQGGGFDPDWGPDN